MEELSGRHKIIFGIYRHRIFFITKQRREDTLNCFKEVSWRFMDFASVEVLLVVTTKMRPSIFWYCTKFAVSCKHRSEHWD
jgi:hypothetical protein